jgi:hypothetical protein
MSPDAANARQARLSLLARENLGRRERPVFLTDLSAALGNDVEIAHLADLLLTDVLEGKLTEQYQALVRGSGSGFLRTYSTQQSARLFDMTKQMSLKIGRNRAYLLTKRSNTCGAVIVQADSAISRAKSLVALDGDSLRLVSEDQTQGLLLDWRADDPSEAYELAVWGNRWAAVAHSCDS